jgi:hypothetical protein
MNQLATTFKGAATESANTFQGSMDKLAVASDNVKEIIGRGIIDSLKILAGDSTVDDLAKSMEDLATYTSNTILGISDLLKELKKIPAAINIPGLKFLFKFTPISIFNSRGKKIADEAAKAAEAAARGFPGVTTGDSYKTAYKLLGVTKKLTAEELKKLKAKQLQLAIDKANLALGKGSSVFDMEKIQLAAAERNQAEQLGKITNSAQLLQITNDLARLKVKEDIANLEDAIAAKDVKAIESATNKLNKDLGILGALTGQELKLRDIESILKDIVPKDLINLANLEDALAKLKAMGDTKIIVPIGTPSPVTPITPVSANTPLTPQQELELLKKGRTLPVSNGTNGANGGSGNAGAYASYGFPGSDKGYGSTNINVTVEAGLGDPNAIAETVTKVIQDAIDRGTLRTLSAA